MAMQARDMMLTWLMQRHAPPLRVLVLGRYTEDAVLWCVSQPAVATCVVVDSHYEGIENTPDNQTQFTVYHWDAYTDATADYFAAHASRFHLIFETGHRPLSQLHWLLSSRYRELLVTGGFFWCEQVCAYHATQLGYLQEWHTMGAVVFEEFHGERHAGVCLLPKME